MSKFILGLVFGVLVVFLGGYCYVRGGFVATGRHGGRLARKEDGNAFPPRSPRSSCSRSPETDSANRRQPNCGDDDLSDKLCELPRRHSSSPWMLADALYPRAPQFTKDAPHMPENQNFYIIRHGVRLSGMPAWRQVLTEQEVWQVTDFLSHMDKLPPLVSASWKSAAGGSEDGSSSHDGPNMDMKDNGV